MLNVTCFSALFIQMREIQTQVHVEEVIRGRSLKIYNERCRSFYKPTENSNSAV